MTRQELGFPWVVLQMAGLQQAARRGHGPSIVTKPLPNIQQVNRVLKRICCGIGQGCPWRIGPAIVSERPLTLPLLALHAHPARRRFRQLPPPHSPANSKWPGVQFCPGHEGAGRRVWGEGEGFSPQMWEQITAPKCGGRIRTPRRGYRYLCWNLKKPDVGADY